MAERVHGRGVLSPLTQERLRTLRPRDREGFLELWEDARTHLQKELLERAVLAGRTGGELHGFADSIRGLTDSVVFRLCYELDGELGPAGAFPQRLRAEADPMDGFLLNQRAEEATQPWGQLERPSRLGLSRVSMPGTALPKRELGVSAEVGRLRLPGPKPVPRPRSPGVFAPIPTIVKALPSQIRRSRELSAAGVTLRTATARTGTARTGTGGGLFDDASASRAPGSESEAMLNHAFAGLGLRFRERIVDGPRFTLETALDRAALALERGIPVPVVLGSEVGDFVAYAMFLQVFKIGSRRAFQLHDPFSRTTAWVAERDLIARRQLPGMDRTRRRLTAISLPV